MRARDVSDAATKLLAPVSSEILASQKRDAEKAKLILLSLKLQLSGRAF